MIKRTTHRISANERGVALTMALIITLVVFLLVISTMYVVTTSTSISGAGKRYATACEAADGAVEVMKDSIHRMMNGDPVSRLQVTEQVPDELAQVLSEDNRSTIVNLKLEGTGLFTTYNATITVHRLYAKALPGHRLEFARAAGASGGTAIYFRISTVVNGPNNTKAESTALYRFVG